MPKISVIVPVYMVEKYLEKCIRSVLGQTYADFELILVDDGSTDGSSRICESFSEEDGRIKLIRQENGGLSFARNAGLAQASGEYVFFLDSDDYLEPDALEHLMNAMETNGCDVVVGNYFYSYEDHEDVMKCSYDDNTLLDNKSAMEALVTGKIQNFAWGKLIRADIVKKHPFPIGKLFEDHYWAHFVIADSTSVLILPAPVVHYRQRSSSISYTMDPKRLDMIDGWICRREFLEREYPNLTELFLKKTVVPGVCNLAWLIFSRMKKDKSNSFERLRMFCIDNSLSEYAEENIQKTVRSIEKGFAAYAIRSLIVRMGRRKK